MNFQEATKKHLGRYKTQHFPNIADGLWASKPYKHIIDKKQERLNLLANYRDMFMKVEAGKINLHGGFHHLNSSQAMCINFFYPLIVEKKLDIILNYLGINDNEVNYATAKFEKKSHLDGVKNRRPTCFDFYFETMSEKKLFFEIKYSEAGFGKAKKDNEHIDKYDKVYAHNLDAIMPAHRNIDSFLGNYQIMRNIIHLGDNQYLIFLYPAGNKNIAKGAKLAKDKFIRGDLVKNFYDVTWEELVSFALAQVSCEKLIGQYLEFQNKYQV